MGAKQWITGYVSRQPRPARSWLGGRPTGLHVHRQEASDGQMTQLDPPLSHLLARRMWQRRRPAVVGRRRCAV